MSVLSRLLQRGDSSGLIIEPMRRRHVNQIMVIENDSYPRPWTPSVFESEIDLARRGERHYLVARVGTELVGYGGLMFAVGDAHVTNIAVASSHQRRGVARRLLADLAWEAIHRHAEAMTLEVRANNVSAQALYRTFGFVPAGVRQRYYENTDDAIVMWCHDINTASYKARLNDVCPEAHR